VPFGDCPLWEVEAVTKRERRLWVSLVLLTRILEDFNPNERNFEDTIE